MELKNTTTAFVLSFGSTEGQLVRVEVLVLFSTLTWLLLELLGSFRRRNSNGSFRILVWALHTLSTVLAPYTIGLLQAGPFGDQTFALWGVILLLMQVNSSSISVYSIQDIGQRKSKLVQQVSQIFLVLWLILNASGGNKSYTATCWIFLIHSIILTRRNFVALGQASRKGGLLECSKVIADYMLTEHHMPQDMEDPIPNPHTMKGYKYIFHGDEDQQAYSLPTAPEYRVKVVRKGLFSTIDTVWEWIDSRGFIHRDTVQFYKETTLSYTLFNLLKRRFCGYPLGEAGLQKTLDFVLDGLLYETRNYDCAFRVIEGELLFLYDFFYTRMDTSILYMILAVPFLSTAIVWNSISGAFSKQYHRNLEQGVDGTDVIRGVTIVLLASLIIVFLVGVRVTPGRYRIVKQVYEDSEETTDGQQETPEAREQFVSWGRSTWEKKLGQYCLLRNFNYDPRNVLHYLSLGLVDATRKGQKAGEKMELDDCIIRHVLYRFKQNDGKLENGQAALARSGLGSQFSWACTLPTHIHTILVWHIATTICQDNNGLPDENDTFGCFVAVALSNYCAYLVAFVPDMLPGHGYDTQLIFDAVVMEAQGHLAPCKTLRDRCEKLKMGLQGDSDSTILGMGAKLGRQLMEKVPVEGDHWKVLIDADIHLEKLTAGGEFMTHLWALLTHAGILERPNSSSRVDPVGGSDGTTAQDSGILERPNSSSWIDPLGGSDGTTTQDSGILERPDSSSEVYPPGGPDGTTAHDSGILERPSSSSIASPSMV